MLKKNRPWLNAKISLLRPLALVGTWQNCRNCQIFGQKWSILLPKNWLILNRYWNSISELEALQRESPDFREENCTVLHFGFYWNPFWEFLKSSLLKKLKQLLSYILVIFRMYHLMLRFSVWLILTVVLTPFKWMQHCWHQRKEISCSSCWRKYIFEVNIFLQTGTSFDSTIRGFLTVSNAIGWTDIITNIFTVQFQRGQTAAITTAVYGNIISTSFKTELVFSFKF